MSSAESTVNQRCWAEIDLTALDANVRSIRAAIPPTMRFLSVVKANAYGHGLAPLATHLLQGGVDGFAVATLDEAEVLRHLGHGWPVLHLGALVPGEAPRAARLGTAVTLSDPEEAHRVARETAASSLDVHIKIDTGMNRLGIDYRSCARLVEAIATEPNLRLRGIYTHYADAPEDPAFTRLQQNRFLEALAIIPEPIRNGLLIHADNSGGVEVFGQATPFTAARVGLLQFGIRQHASGTLAGAEVRPVLSLHSRVVLVKTAEPGATIGYARTCRLERQTRFAVVGGGYGDGIPLGLSNRGEVLIRGHRCRVLGRVTMDQTVVDVSDCPTPEAGEPATWIGEQSGSRISIEEVIATSGLIPWAFLTGITSRVPRIYRHNRQ